MHRHESWTRSYTAKAALVNSAALDATEVKECIHELELAKILEKKLEFQLSKNMTAP
jgi:hypothetical protein